MFISLLPETNHSEIASKYFFFFEISIFFTVSMTWQFIKYYNCHIICLFQSIQFSRSIQSHTHTHIQTEAAFIPEGQEQLLSSTCMQRVINLEQAERATISQLTQNPERPMQFHLHTTALALAADSLKLTDRHSRANCLNSHSAILLTTPSTHINQNTEGNLYETVQKRKCKMCHSVRIKADGYERKIESAYIKKIIIYHCGVMPENMFLEITGNVLIKDKVKGNASYEVC